MKEEIKKSVLFFLRGAEKNAELYSLPLSGIQKVRVITRGNSALEMLQRFAIDNFDWENLADDAREYVGFDACSESDMMAFVRGVFHVPTEEIARLYLDTVVDPKSRHEEKPTLRQVIKDLREEDIAL